MSEAAAAAAAAAAATKSAHDRLRRHPLLFASIAVSHTLLCAGIVFGWASLLPLLREEGVDLSAADFTRIFTHGAVGNYLSSLPFGLILDRFGPKRLGILASLFFASGVWLCVMAVPTGGDGADPSRTWCLDLGFALLGFSGPAIQLPVLHLARLFPGDAVEGGSGGAALFMSAQAGAFDGGTIVFCIFSLLTAMIPGGVSLKTMFRIYMMVPIYTLTTSIVFWPNEILPDASDFDNNNNINNNNIDVMNSLVAKSPGRRGSYTSVGSPYISPKTIRLEEKQRHNPTAAQKSSLIDKPLSVILSHPPFYCLAAWVAIHILKLNFVVATINDQLEQQVEAGALPDGQVDTLISLFGAMLPFGFVVLPIVAYLLNRSEMLCFQVATTVGVMYGAVLTFYPNQAWYLVGLVFPAVATSRQLVYSTVFHQTGELFGFENYGVLLGLTNVVVSAVSMCQGPLVEWAQVAKGGYFGPNTVLLVLTLPLFAIVYGTRETPKSKQQQITNETTSLLSGARLSSSSIANEERRPRTLSETGL